MRTMKTCAVTAHASSTKCPECELSLRMIIELMPTHEIAAHELEIPVCYKTISRDSGHFTMCCSESCCGTTLRVVDEMMHKHMDSMLKRKRQQHNNPIFIFWFARPFLVRSSDQHQCAQTTSALIF